MTAQPDTAPGVVPQWTIGWRLQRALAFGGIPAGDLAAELQVSRATVSRWLNDRGLPPRWVYLERIAGLTGVAALWLCHGDLKPCGPRPVADLADVSAGRRGSNFMQSSPTLFAEMAS
jgi:transcriptional regulator with XRE-family HTH domain